MNTDPRFVRSQRQLHVAVLKLASETPLEDITVTAIAQEAEVHRSTVYDHAESPTELLREALYVELDELRHTYVVHGGKPDSMKQLMLAVIDHVERHEAIYCHMEEKSGAQIREILSTHFVGSMQRLFQDHSVQIPTSTLTLGQDTIHEITLKALCETNVSILISWLHTPKPRSAQDALELMHLLTPSWWSHY